MDIDDGNFYKTVITIWSDKDPKGKTLADMEQHGMVSDRNTVPVDFNEKNFSKEDWEHINKFFFNIDVNDDDDETKRLYLELS